MGTRLIDAVYAQLNSAGIRTGRGYPSGKLPELESPAVAVQVAQLDQEKETEVMLLSVFVPVSFGAYAAQELACEVADVMRTAGGVCKQDKVQYRKDSHLFCAEVQATFRGQETKDGWVAAPRSEDAGAFILSVDQVALPNVVSFEFYRDVSNDTSQIENAPWHFKLVENYALMEKEPDVPENPFTIRVSRQKREDTFVNCVLTGQQRKITSEGVVHIREGKAESYRFLNVE